MLTLSETRAREARERPIIFSAPMVKAILAGRKSQTRRILKLPTKGQYVNPAMGGWEPTTNGGDGVFLVARDGTRQPVPATVGIWHRTTGKCLDAPYQVGDRLWVKESHYRTDDGDEEFAVYACDEEAVREHLASIDALPATVSDDVKRRHRKLRPSIHMPRALSRITLEVTEVRVERLQDISEADAIAEGVGFWRQSEEVLGNDRMSNRWCRRSVQVALRRGEPCPTVGAYALLWERIHGKDAWDADPWVAAITFRPVSVPPSGGKA